MRIFKRIFTATFGKLVLHGINLNQTTFETKHCFFYLQSPGFALVIDRRRGSLQEVQIEFDKIITLFPAKIKEVFLLYHYGEGKNITGVLDRSKDEL